MREKKKEREKIHACVRLYFSRFLRGSKGTPVAPVHTSWQRQEGKYNDRDPPAFFFLLPVVRDLLRLNLGAHPSSDDKVVLVLLPFFFRGDNAPNRLWFALVGDYEYVFLGFSR